MSRPLPLRPLRETARKAPIDLAELERRALYGGLLDDIPELTNDERIRWEAHRRSCSDWAPQRALRFAWCNVDPIHGRGEWSRDRFMTALANDSREIEDVIREHPHQRARLRTWLAQMEQFVVDREMNVECNVGPYYTRLQALGYDAKVSTTQEA
ncbi:MAG TPA: hypothetical protein VFD27_20775 [Chthoniobacteraceae bacterium]|nr:hypothetical protein [Chthoniobacteraceae bacterium]